MAKKATTILVDDGYIIVEGGETNATKLAVVLSAYEFPDSFIPAEVIVIPVRNDKVRELHAALGEIVELLDAADVERQKEDDGLPF